MGFEDPSDAVGSDAFIWSEFRRVRDEIYTAFKKFYSETIQPQTAI
jgi:arsenate reductase